MIRTPTIAALALVLAAGTAAAQPAPHPKKTPTPKELDAARAHFRDAEAAKARGDFQTAAVEYLAAYELFEEPEFFFDVAEVHRLAGNEQQALDYYERYLQLDPQGRGAAQARASAESLRRSIAAKQDADRRVAMEAQRKAQEADAQNNPGGQGAKPPDAQHPPDGSARPEDDEGDSTASARSGNDGRALRIAGLASAGAGVAAVGVGIAFGLRAHSISNDASQWTTFDPARYSDGKAAQRNMIVLTAVGSAAVIAGGALYYFGYKASEHGSLVVVPATDGTSFALTAEGRF